MSARVRPASAIAPSAASIVRSSSPRPSLRPIADCPIPEMTALPFRRRGHDATGRKSGKNTGRVILEHDLHRHADAHVVGFDVDEVRREAHVGLLVDRDEGDDVRIGGAVPRLVVHRERMHRCARPLTSAGRGLAALALRADRCGRVNQVRTRRAPEEAELAVGPRRPEERARFVERRQHAKHGIGHLTLRRIRVLSFSVTRLRYGVRARARKAPKA